MNNTVKKRRETMQRKILSSLGDVQCDRIAKYHKKKNLNNVTGISRKSFNIEEIKGRKKKGDVR